MELVELLKQGQALIDVGEFEKAFWLLRVELNKDKELCKELCKEKAFRDFAIVNRAFSDYVLNHTDMEGRFIP